MELKLKLWGGCKMTKIKEIPTEIREIFELVLEAQDWVDNYDNSEAMYWLEKASDKIIDFLKGD